MLLDRTKVKLAMLRAGISTYAELAERVGCSRQNLSSIISRGSCAPATLAKLAAALGVDPAELLEDTHSAGRGWTA